MDKPILGDKNIYPSEEIIYSHLGKKQALWLALFEHVHANHPDIIEEWKYYNDGKSWLQKLTKMKKTICWMSLIEKTFRMTFYFTDKVEQLILDSPISEELKEQFNGAKHYNKIRPLTITFNYKKDVEFAKMLIALKLSIK